MKVDCGKKNREDFMLFCVQVANVVGRLSSGIST